MYQYYIVWPSGYWVNFFVEGWQSPEQIAELVRQELAERRSKPEFYGTGVRAIKDDGYVRIDIALPWKGE